MRLHKHWDITSIVWILSASLLLLTTPFLFWNWKIFIAFLIPVIGILIFTGIRMALLQKNTRDYLTALSQRLDPHQRDSLEATPLPVVLLNESGEILWYNTLFRNTVLEKRDVYGQSVETVFDGATVQKLTKRQLVEGRVNARDYTINVAKLSLRDTLAYVLYCIDSTELKTVTEKYNNSRPVVLSFCIDNGEEVLQNMRDSERAQLLSQAETFLEDWISQNNGVFRKCSNDRFIAMLEQRSLQTILDNKFDILDKIRTVQTIKGESITLSVGVGTGVHLLEAEVRSRQALDMALGRGGDQAAVKTQNGFDFYGGLSKSVERQTRVRSRVVASALRDLIINSENVLLMGHRHSDLDCLGAATALCSVCRGFGKQAYVVYDPQTTLAAELVSRFENQQLFITQNEAMPLVTAKTLLIITDTHSSSMLDIPFLYNAVSSVVVIDHHRKMVDHIDDAVIFYHEPYSSSASEMVAELVQYMQGAAISKIAAEALLAGIMLDTRSFVMKAGVRTFEAAAYLRKMGADTVEVKRLFSENMSLYQLKSEIIATTESYRDTAIAYAKQGGSEMRVAASQAADELLAVRGVRAAFAMFCDNGGVNISARSYGDFNVQLIMEALGGGGHQTMAGAFLKDTDLTTAKSKLKKAIDIHCEEVARHKP